MKQYQDLLRNILANGTRQTNRTGIEAISIPGAMLKFDLAEGFPLLTTKKMAFVAMHAELKAFLLGSQDASYFRELGCKFWDQNANENKAWLSNPNRKGTDDLGRIYGAQWRDWAGYKLLPSGLYERYRMDQVLDAVLKIKNDPTNRRIIINAWRPDEFDQMALPPCHVMYQFIVDTTNNELNLCMYQRSADSFLGIPINIASASMFLQIMAGLCGLTAGTFTHFLADAHIYVNHLDQVEELLSREPKKLPMLVYASQDGVDISTLTSDSLDTYFKSISDIQLIGYDPHPAIKAPMAV